MTKEKREQLMKDAENFKGETDCYIHAEIKNGKGEKIISGNFLAMIHSLVGIIMRISELTNTSFDETITAIRKYKYDFMN